MIRTVANPNMKKRKPAVRPWFEHLIGYLGLGGWRRNGRVTRTVARRLRSAKEASFLPGSFCQTKRRR